jgi:hypothetical protein
MKRRIEKKFKTRINDEKSIKINKNLLLCPKNEYLNIMKFFLININPKSVIFSLNLFYYQYFLKLNFM